MSETNGVTDMTHMAVFDEHMRELQQCINEFNARASGKTDRAELCEIRLEQINALTDVLHKHKRTLDFMAGKPYEPEMHFGEAVVTGVFGGGVG